MNEQLTKLAEHGEFLIADGLDDAIIGYWDDKVVYDKYKCIELLTGDMTYEEAVEYFDYNVEGAYVGEQTPIFITLL